MRSHVWAAQDALYDAVSGATYTGRVTTTLGSPARLEADHVWVAGEVDDWTGEYRTSGLAAKDESFDLRVHVYVQRFGTFVECRDRVKELGQVVEDAIHDDYTLGGAVMLATIVRSQLEESITEDGRARVVLLSMWVRCAAHVIPA